MCVDYWTPQPESLYVSVVTQSGGGQRRTNKPGRQWSAMTNKTATRQLIQLLIANNGLFFLGGVNLSLAKPP